MFEGFNADAIKAIMIAQEESRRLGHNHVGTEMVLLGILGTGSAPKVVGDGIGSRVLRKLGLSMKETQKELERIIGCGNDCVDVEIPFTLIARQSLEQAAREAKQLGANEITTGHLLLGLLSIEKGVHSEILDHFRIDRKLAQQKVLEMLASRE